MTTYTVDNILSVFNSASTAEINAGMYWYNEAHVFAWELDHRNFRRGAGVIASLSPLLRWDKNKEYARLAYDYRGYALEDIISYMPCLPKNAAKALAIANGAKPENVLGGQKVTSFYRNIVDPYSGDIANVTVDKHAQDIAAGERSGYIKNKMRPLGKRLYREIAEMYVLASREVGISPQQMQAITWVTWRNR